MTTVQDSINALYVEAERNANDGTPMFAILHCAPTDEAATTMLSGHTEDLYPVNFDVTSSPAESLAAESLHTDSLGAESRSDQTAGDTGKDHDDSHHDNHNDGDQTHGHRLLVARLDDLYALAEQEFAAPAPELVDESPDNLADGVPDNSERNPVDHPAPVNALPEQPPAPPQMGLDTDLNIADIHNLVQQAWDDGDAHDGVTHESYAHDDGRAADQTPAMTPPRPDQAVSGHTASDAAGPADETDIKAAMVEIAAAVNQLDSPAPAQMNMLRDEIVEAIKAELRATMHSDLAPMVRRAVAEVLAEAAAKELASKKPARKAAARKAPKKAAGAKTATKKPAGKKPAGKKPAKAKRTKSSGASEA